MEALKTMDRGFAEQGELREGRKRRIQEKGGDVVLT